MPSSPITLQPHGSRLHSHAILEAKLICEERGYIELDQSGLEDKSIPGIPDVYVLVQASRTNGHGQGTDTEKRYIIELETNATKKSIEKKKAQYKTSLIGHELLIINLRPLKGVDSLTALEAFLKAMIP